MTLPRILITGASGCVGQHVAHWLIENSQANLLLWLRDPNKLKAIDKNHPRIRLLIGDIRDANNFANELKTVTRVIHTATAWGDPKRAYDVNVLAVKTILKYLDPNAIQQIIYFSTASILDKRLLPLKEAFLYGTEYIQTKARCLQELEKHPLSSKIIAVFPTLVFGGKVDRKSIFPTSYLTEGLIETSKWLWLARWIRINGTFHFIHAADIASICGHLSITSPPHFQNSNQPTLTKLVLGQSPISLNKAVDTLRAWRGLRKTPGLPLTDWLIKVLVRFLPLQITDWDRFSIKQRHFVHDPFTTPETFGLKSFAPRLETVLDRSGLPKA
ncbi:NAD(P)-dependent oxidoreductase [Prochlorococcus sp. MIT 1300]|uniref:NAD-dependent epimerase/dehydratase family protein n=1 Tax=Prochlorococcus sp. MIT 1300 TaxID=3096218 RepID=UPI002A74DC33|nr:NAD(P)-dependent oxidoreductase [Prochlorococcus sp. MIT 1300]